MEGNKIGDSGVTSLVDVLENNTTLVVLNLDNNRIGESGAKQLTRLMSNNPYILSLTFTNNSVPEKYNQPIIMLACDNVKLNKRCNIIKQDIANSKAEHLLFEKLVKHEFAKMQKKHEMHILGLKQQLNEANKTIASLLVLIQQTAIDGKQDRATIKHLQAEINILKKNSGRNTAKPQLATVVNAVMATNTMVKNASPAKQGPMLVQENGMKSPLRTNIQQENAIKSPLRTNVLENIVKSPLRTNVQQQAVVVEQPQQLQAPPTQAQAPQVLAQQPVQPQPVNPRLQVKPKPILNAKPVQQHIDDDLVGFINL